MPAYDGYELTRLVTDSPVNLGLMISSMAEYRSRITTDKPYTGISSLEILPGGQYDIYYGCAAGNATITVWCWPPVGVGVGTCALEVWEIGTDICLAHSESVGTEDWEQLSVTFVAEKKVYKVRLVNRVLPTGDTRAYFDDLV